MSIKKKIKIGLLGICIAILTFGMIMLINNRKQKSNDTEPMLEKFQNEQEVELTYEDNSLSVFLPKELVNSDTAVKTFGQKDIFSKEKVEKSGSSYDIIDNNISQITISTTDNDVLSYSLGDKDYSQISLQSLNKDVNTFEISSYKVSYSIVNVNNRYMYYESIPISDDISLLIMIETNTELNEDQLKEYVERLQK